MALALRYVNEVMNQFPATLVVDETAWPELIRLLGFEGRDLNKLIVGQMRLRMARGGYDGLMQQVDALLAQVDALLAENAELRKQVDQLTAPSPVLEPVHG